MLADLSTDKEKKVELYVLANEATQDEQLASTLRHYAELSPNITVTYADPAVSPNFYEKYTQDTVSVNSRETRPIHRRQRGMTGKDS